MYTDENTCLIRRLKPKVAVLAVQFSVGLLLLPLMLQTILHCLLALYQQQLLISLGIMTSNVASLPGSYGKVTLNVILNRGHIVGTNRNQVNTPSPFRHKVKVLMVIYSTNESALCFDSLYFKLCCFTYSSVNCYIIKNSHSALQLAPASSLWVQL